ncbi:DUF4005 domain-containing protein [Pseudoscourfieldia marina]
MASSTPPSAPADNNKNTIKDTAVTVSLPPPPRSSMSPSALTSAIRSIYAPGSSSASSPKPGEGGTQTNKSTYGFAAAAPAGGGTSWSDLVPGFCRTHHHHQTPPSTKDQKNLCENQCQGQGQGQGQGGDGEAPTVSHSILFQTSSTTTTHKKTAPMVVTHEPRTPPRAQCTLAGAATADSPRDVLSHAKGKEDAEDNDARYSLPTRLNTKKRLYAADEGQRNILPASHRSKDDSVIVDMWLRARHKERKLGRILFPASSVPNSEPSSGASTPRTSQEMDRGGGLFSSNLTEELSSSLGRSSLGDSWRESGRFSLEENTSPQISPRALVSLLEENSGSREPSSVHEGSRDPSPRSPKRSSRSSAANSAANNPFTGGSSFSERMRSGARGLSARLDGLELDRWESWRDFKP